MSDAYIEMSKGIKQLWMDGWDEYIGFGLPRFVTQFLSKKGKKWNFFLGINSKVKRFLIFPLKFT